MLIYERAGALASWAECFPLLGVTYLIVMSGWIKITTKVNCNG